MDLLTHTRLATFSTCPRKHQYRYELGIQRDRDSAPLRFGTRWHEALDQLANHQALGQILRNIATSYETMPDYADVDDWELEREVLCRMLVAYANIYANSPITCVQSEQEFRMPIKNPATNAITRTWELGGKIDKIVRLPDGRLALMEHKTTGDTIDDNSDYWGRLRVDPQISLYVIAARAKGFDVTTVLYDVLKKPGIAPRKLTKAELTALANTGLYFGESFADQIDPMPERETVSMYGARLTADIQERPGFYFARKEIPRLDADLDEAAYDLWAKQRMIRESQLANRWPRNPASCLQPFKCEFTSLCFQGIDPEGKSDSDLLQLGYRKTDNVHPELSVA